MNEEIEGYENKLELELFKEYRDVIGLFKYVVETERRFYLCNHVDVQARPVGGDVFFELTLSDAWVWDIYRSSRFVRSVRVVTYKDVNVEELSTSPRQRARRRERVSTAHPACRRLSTGGGFRIERAPSRRASWWWR